MLLYNGCHGNAPRWALTELTADDAASFLPASCPASAEDGGGGSVGGGAGWLVFMYMWMGLLNPTQQREAVYLHCSTFPIHASQNFKKCSYLE